MTQPSPYFIRRQSEPLQPEVIEARPVFSEPDEAKGIAFLQYWRTIRKHLTLIIALVAAAAVITAIKVFSETPLYTAEATILLEPGTPQIFANGSVQQSAAVDSDDEESHFLETQCAILRSRSLAATVVRAEGLDHRAPAAAAKRKPGLIGGLKTSLAHWISGVFGHSDSAASSVHQGQTPPAGGARAFSAAVDAYLGGVRITPVNNTDLVKIGYVSNDPRLAADLANAHAHAYIRQGIQLHSQANEEAEHFLKDKLVELKDKLEKSEIGLNNYRRDKGIVPGLMSLDGKETMVIDRLGQLSQDLTKAQVERIGYEAQVQLFQSGKLDPLPEMAGNSEVQEVEGEISKIDSEYAGMAKQFKPDYPPMQQLAARRDQLQQRLDDAKAEAARGIQARYKAALDKEQKLQEELNHERGQALNLNDASVEYAILQREVDTNRELYNSVLARMKDVGLAAQAQASNTVIIDDAEQPGSPSSPNKTRAIAQNTVLALAASIGLCFLLEFLDNTVKSPEDAERLLHLPSLGAIPSFSSMPKRLGYPPRRIKPPTESAIAGLPQAASHELAGAAGSYSMVGEAYRTLRTGILLSRAGSPPKTILFTSAKSGEGKTVTSANTALLFAHNGSRVVLVDADLRRPRCHKVLAVENHMGLTEVLIGSREVHQVLHSTSTDRLFLLSSGSIPPNPTELLGSKKMHHVLEQLAEEFDVVIVDSPPVLPVSDSMILSTIVDGVVLVVGSDDTPKQMVKAACMRLEYARAKIFGVVLNKVDVRSHDYKSYYHFYHDYYERVPNQSDDEPPSESTS